MLATSLPASCKHVKVFQLVVIFIIFYCIISWQFSQIFVFHLTFVTHNQLIADIMISYLHQLLPVHQLLTVYLQYIKYLQYISIISWL